VIRLHTAHPYPDGTDMELSGGNLIGGEFREGRGATFRGIDPSTDAALEPTFREAEEADVEQALAGAEAAFESFGRSDGELRGRFLRAIAEELLELGDGLIDRAGAETGLPAARLQGERARTVAQLRLFAEHVEEGSWVEARIDTPDPARAPIPKPDLRRMLIPLGPVAVFGASNFPLAFSVAGGDTASALAAGCTVVFKAHPAHPGTSELAARAIARAAGRTGLPSGVFSLLHGWSHEVGLAMVRHPLTRAVAFTGSLRGGRALFDAAAARPDPIPVYAEMGSVNPVFLLPSAVAERGEAIAQGLAQSITLGVGQFCTNPGVVVAMESEGFGAVRSLLAERIRESAAGVMLYDRISEGYTVALNRWAEKGVESVARAAAGTSSCPGQPALHATDAATFLGDPELQQEVFGPASLLVAATGAEELERVAESLEGQLTVTIHATARELQEHSRLIDILQRKAGRLIFNGFPTGVEVGHAMQHGGPYPASTDARTTSVGTAAIFRFARPVCYQDFPQTALPAALRDRNELGIWRLLDGEFTRADL
jgi:2,5-dioxopentanoate dehydrogenase